jgi:general secretion pathway protein D
MRRVARAVAWGAAAVVAAGLFFSPGALLSPGRAAAEDEAEILLKEEIDIEFFLRNVATTTDKPLVWNPQDKAIQGKKIKGALNLRAPKSQLFDLVRAILTFYDLVMIPVGPVGYQIFLVMDARQTAAIVKLKPKFVDLSPENLDFYESQDGLFITTTLKVENMTNLRDARNALSRIVTGQNIGNVQEVSNKAMVVTDFAPNVVAIYRLLRQMDIKPEGKTVTSAYIQLQWATADEVEPVLTDLFTGRERVSRGPVVQPPQGGATVDVDEDPEPRIISDLRTNQIIVYATLDDINEIKEVIAHLDVQLVITTSFVHVIQLKNLEAEDTADVLNQLIEASSIFGTAGSGISTGGGGQPGSPATRGRVAGGEGLPAEQEKPAVVADVKSNSIIIAASERQFKDLKKIIDEIDIRKSQVLIEAALIELTLDDAYKLAVELGFADDNGLRNDGVKNTSGMMFTSFGQTGFFDKDGDTFFTDRLPAFVDSGDAVPTGLVGGIFAFGQVPLIFNMLNTVSQSRILQLPSIVAADNEEAFIEAKDEQPTTASTTTTGGVTSGGFRDFESAGTTLRISPHIADNSYLLLNINLTVSAFQGNARTLGDGTVIPAPRVTRNLTTAVTVPDRHTVVLGGLLGQTERSTIQKTPLLADIPILGELFKSTDKSNRQTSLFLFVTPTIMGEPNSFDVLDRESCKRKQKADQLIGYTDIYNSYFVGCQLQDPATGRCAPVPGCVRGSGSGTDALERSGALEATRFAGVSQSRLDAELAARRQALKAPGAAKPRASR